MLSTFLRSHFFRAILLLSCAHFQVCFGLTNPYPKDLPWFTGPLFTPSPRVIKVGHFNLEPYLIWVENTAEYGKNWKAKSIPKFYELNPQWVLKVGLTERMNSTCIIQSVHNRTQGVSGSGFGDFPLGIEYQLFEEKEGQIPVKLTLQEIFPTGRYQKLNSAKLGTDTTGLGAYTTAIAITFGKLFHFSNDHYLSTRANLTLTLPSTVYVKGANAYGGDCTTKGRVFPGSSFSFYLGGEYSLTANWVLALDLIGEFTAKCHFRGRSLKPVGIPSSAIFSAAPGIEYNWNKSVGVIVGSWFSIAGRNTNRFGGAMGAINLYY